MADYSQSESTSPAYVTDDREAYPYFWIAAYTRPRSEKKADRELRALGIETFLPIQRQIRQWSDRRKLIDTVVIPMIVFLNITVDDIQKIAKHPLIIKILSLPGERLPAKIPLAQIEKLKFILGQSDIPVNYDPNIFKVDDSVRVTRGNLMGLCGEVVSCSDSLCELVIKIDLLGGAKLRIPKADLEIIK